MNKSLSIVRQLVEDFKQQESAFLSPTYQESRVRQDFIDKFFAALGWDVTHLLQKNPYEQEVVIENRVHAEGSQRRADYAFHIAPNFRDVKFFAEAKKPSRNLANPDDYYQAIRYGWNKKTSLVVLTDFEEFHIIDCRYEPDIATALDRKIESFHYSEYADEEKFARIFYLFGREAVADGSLEKFVASLPKPKGKVAKKGVLRATYKAVDESFLELLDGYREMLAKEFKNKNQQLDGEELTEAVQRTLDRLVFIRFLEDKSIEEASIIGLNSKPSAWNAFTSLCRSLEPKYNGLVFKQHRVIDGDDFIPPDNDVFGAICRELSDPGSPYDFDKIPISILGSIYERFLGKVVSATGKRAKVEEKPEVRKAGGVYYTPEYIVRYIVKETVGKLIEGKTPAEIAKMAFADIACGSGSFLLEVYGTLLDYHTRWYNEHPEYVKTRTKKGDVEPRDGALALSLKMRQQILTNNIYGVDIDAQAYEVTQVSLYLKLLEEATMSEGYQFALLKEKLLPDLKENIICGNSLIGTDIETQPSLFEEHTPSRLPSGHPSQEGTQMIQGKKQHGHNAFPSGEGNRRGVSNIDALKPMNFADAFPDIMNRGGFDAIVGNPPYIRIQAMTEFNPLQVELLKKRYNTARKGNYDIYVVFVERALSLLNKEGQLGYILPHKFFNAKYGEPLRDLIAKGRNLLHVVHFGDQQVFDGATTYTTLLFLQSSASKEVKFVKVDDLDGWRETGQAMQGTIPIANVSEKDWNFAVGESGGLFEKLRNMPVKLGDVADRIAQGIRTSANEVYVLDVVSSDSNFFLARSEALDKQVKIEKRIVSLFLQGKEIKPYMIKPSGKLVIIPYTSVDGNVTFIDQREMKQSFPKTFEYLCANKAFLENRENGKMRGSKWYAYVYPKNLSVMKSPKILIPDIADRASFALDVNGEYAFTSGYGITLKQDIPFSVKYALGILNSKLLDFFLKRVSTTMRGGFFRYFTQFIEQLPIRTINFSDPADKSRHDNIVKLVEQMLAAKEKLAQSRTDAETNRLEAHCASLDRQIDAAVYELYGLTEEEIKIVEGNP